jgi:hypothetical protein
MQGKKIMSRLPVALVAGLAAMSLVGTAGAAERWNTTSVALPDGSVAEIEYMGDVPPRVTIFEPEFADDRAADDFDYREYEDDYDDVEYDAADAAPPVATRARRFIQPRSAVPEPYPDVPQFVVAGDPPSGSTYDYTLITTGADGSVCTQRTEWRSRGGDEEPEVRRTESGAGCADAAGDFAPAPVPDTAIPRPKIVPVDPDAF